MKNKLKKLFCAVMVPVMLLSVLGCGAQPSQEQTAQPEAAGTTTLMVYMVGSDLEPKSGAASADLQEIAESGIDLSRNKVVVCAGGSPYWHSEQVDTEQLNILALEADEFLPVSTTRSASMGEAEQLRAFLEYCYTQYPADEYALILWDHGNGPVMGYGKDILYNNDALLLSEMAQALAGSPFSGENKLAWVGFDACLMASAELSCLLADYAHYLIASQEIEPAFGWDYSFLSLLGEMDTPRLLQTVAEDYMAACDAYYRERNYDHYDVTLSVVDLSFAGELEGAINDLFAAAAGEVEHYYDLLAMNRVQSRALGRATTGSEYDLVDLRDMAVQLAAQYPELTDTLLAVIDRMVVTNATSIESCCGMSLYYPFYNKYYYEKDWRTVYTALNMFPAYQTYLEAYEKTWLKEDKLELTALGAVPEETGKNTYSVKLPEEQAKSYASAVYHVMKRESGEIYRKVYSSQDVTWENNTLTAEYDGMAIYVQTNGGTTFVPPLTAVDRIDRLYRYSGKLQLSNTAYQPEDLTDKELPEESFSNWRYLLTLNSETGKVEMSGTVPLAENTDQDLVEYGRIAEADWTQYGEINFYHAQSRYLTRYENGVIKPLEDWYSTDVTSGYGISLAEGYNFSYAPLAGGEYYLMFEITDTQSGSYCTELLPITVEDPVQTEEVLPVTEASWKAGEERVLLKEQDDVKVYLITRDTENDGTRYYIEAENFNDYEVRVTVRDVVVNNTLMTDGVAFFKVHSYDFMYDELTLGICEGTGDLEDLQSLTMEITVTKARSGAVLWPKQLLQVDMANAPKTDTLPQYATGLVYDAPFMEARADMQVIYESEELRLTLMGMGTSTLDPYAQETLWVLAENLSDQTLNTGIFGLVINGYFLGENSGVTLPGGMKTYLPVEVGYTDRKNLGFDQIHSLTLLAAASEGELWWQHETECLWCPVELSEAGANQSVKAGKVLWEENGVRISWYKEDEYSNTWLLLVENKTAEDICLAVVEDSVPYHVLVLSDEKLGAGQRRISQLSLLDLEEVPLPEEVTFRFQVRNFDETKVLFTAEEMTTITIG